MIITVNDLLVLKEALWPHERLWSKQVDIAESVVRDKVTVVPAAHEVGKDYVAGFVVTSVFTLCAAMEVQCKIVTTSVTAAQLANLWGEIDRFVRGAKVPITVPAGRLIYNHQYLGRVGNAPPRWPYTQGPALCGEKDSYAVAAVVTNEHKGEGLSGHHAGDGFTLFVADECSGMSDIAFSKASEWADHMLLIGNPYPCSNFFYRAVKGDPATGDPGGDRKAA